MSILRPQWKLRKSGLSPEGCEDSYRTEQGCHVVFLHELARNLGSADTRTVNLTQKHIRGRLAEALIVLRQQYGYEEDGVTLRMYMSREDLANFSNMTTSNAIRTLTAFVSERLIYVDGRQIKITDEPQLLKISKYG